MIELEARHRTLFVRYDYADAADFLENLEARLEVANPGSIKMLLENKVDVTDVAFKLASVLPNIISTELSVAGSRNVLAAQLADVMLSMRTAKPLAPTETREAFVARRAHKVQSRTRKVTSSGPALGAGGARGEHGKQLLVPRPPAPAKKDIKFAVGFSTEEDAATAAEAAWRQLRTKLSNVPPHCVIATVSLLHTLEERAIICATLRDALPPSVSSYRAHHGKAS